jgi:hypothetical protein
MKIADLFSDMGTLLEARKAAEAVLRDDPSLSGREYGRLRLQIEHFFDSLEAERIAN